MKTDHFPRMFRVQQIFPVAPKLNIQARVQEELAPLASSIKPGAKIGVAVGSRGISNLVPIVRATVDFLKQCKADPFIFPAMGSHGGATPEGQRDVLASYDVTEATMGVPVRPSMDVEQIDTTKDGVPVFCSVEALRSDGVIIVNRIKPHTDFAGDMGSGIMKMCVIGLGKRTGASAAHAAATRMGHEQVLRTVSRCLIAKAPVLGGLAILENQFHETARLVFLPKERIEPMENKLFVEARDLMPRLPFEELDLLIVDQLGKNISGAGMDPNVIGRGVQGYSSALNAREWNPVIRRIFVRDLTPETHGNGIGVGLADFTTTRLVEKLDKKAVFINSLTSLTPHAAKIPMHFDRDDEVLTHALATLAMDDISKAKVVRIKDTLTLENIEVSEAFLEEVRGKKNLRILSEPVPMRFEGDGQLA